MIIQKDKLETHNNFKTVHYISANGTFKQNKGMDLEFRFGMMAQNILDIGQKIKQTVMEG